MRGCQRGESSTLRQTEVSRPIVSGSAAWALSLGFRSGFQSKPCEDVSDGHAICGSSCASNPVLAGTPWGLGYRDPSAPGSPLMAMPHVRLWCPGRCQMPGRAGPACPEPCFKAPGHAGRCGCKLHVTQPFLTPAVTEPPTDTFAALLRWCADKGGPAVALHLSSRGFATLAAVQAAGPQALLDAGAPVESAHLALASQQHAAPSRQLATLRRDHPVLKPTTGGRLDLALAAAATPESRTQALQELYAEFYAQSSGGPRGCLPVVLRQRCGARRLGERLYSGRPVQRPDRDVLVHHGAPPGSTMVRTGVKQGQRVRRRLALRLHLRCEPGLCT